MAHDVAEEAALGLQHLQPPRDLGRQVGIEAGVSFGGAESPFFMSRCRWPMICRSTVMTSAEHFASFARANSRFMKSSSLSV
jgi:hypothetical protein